MGNGKNLKRFSLDARHFHPRRTHWHPWKRQTSDMGPFPQKALNRRCRYMPFNHKSLHISGVTRSLLRANTTLLLDGIHVLGDMVINAKPRRGDVFSPLSTAAATR